MADSVDPSAPLDFEPVDFDPMAGVTVDLTAASLLSLTTIDDDGVGEMPNYEDDEEEDDDERQGEDDDDDDDEEEDMLEKAREATRKREAQIAANKKLLASFGLGLDLINGKPVTAKLPRKTREPKAKPAVPVGRPATRASLSSAAAASAAAVATSTPSTPPATATPSTPIPSTPPATSTRSTPPVTSTPSTAPTPPANPSPTPPPNLSTSPMAPVAGPAAMDVDVEEQDVVQDDDKMDVDDGLDPAIAALKQAICEKSVNSGWLLKGDDSKNASWLLNVLDEIGGVPLGDEFVALARALVETEREYEYRNGLGRLATKSRPQQVADWIQNYRKATPTKCAVRNVTTFSTQWWAWWRANQPGWQTYDERGRPVRMAALPSGVKWEKLVVAGQNGMSSFAAALYWWGCKEKEDGQPSQDWHEAVEEVTWVLGGLRMARAAAGE
ncbi:hypothetical protein C8F01DRAFT_1147396 [Mycena amicta]|nr:hypothetical protein C8F01DRAFT_1147396 [Mycena amicta]